MEDFIYVTEYRNEELFRNCLAFFERHTSRHEITYYTEGENTKTTKLTLKKDSSFLNDTVFHFEKKALIESIRLALDDLVDRMNNIGYIQDVKANGRMFYSAFQLRKVYGPTRQHIDNVFPQVVDTNGKRDVYVRIATIIITFTDSNDVLHFPYQNKQIQLHKGTVVMFPPYWNFSHYATKGDTSLTRFCLQTWILERLELPYMDMQVETII